MQPSPLGSVAPRLDPADAATAGRQIFGVGASAAKDLGSERDQTFLLVDPEGNDLLVLKVSNAAEDPAVLDMEAAAALHVHSIDPDLKVALPVRPATSDPGESDDPTALRSLWQHDGSPHWVRGYHVLPGASRIDATTLRDEALIAWGTTSARLDKALRSFVHPGALRLMLWDVQHALQVRDLVGHVREPATRELVSRVLDRYEQAVAPAWTRLRAQVVHTDLTVDNTLTDENGFVTGIIDFGDMSYSAMVTELASVLDSVAVGRDTEEQLRVARLVLDGFQQVIELEPIELALVGDLWAARSAITIAISSWRVEQGLEERAFAERYNDAAAATLRGLEEIGWEAVAGRLGATAQRPETSVLAGRRDAVFGPAMEPLSYDEPLDVVSGEGVWITDSGGRRYLDAYNNVPCVGHSHPRVTVAIARQSRTLNTHMRYLHPMAVELAERLAATCSPALDTVLFVNSGSEANELAWRMATLATGRRGALCTSFAYHGVTEAAAALSPETWLEGPRPAHVFTWDPPDAYRDEHLGAEAFGEALARASESHPPAAVILDGLLTSDGIADLDAAYVRKLLDLAHAAGALWIADEVQAGHCRTGESMWCYERFGITPDFVTLGKPMGNGHPVAAVVTRREIAETLVGNTLLFSTFGGNPVSAAAALAVLDVLEDERVLERVKLTGRALQGAIRDVAQSWPVVGDVRGVGLSIGIELVSDPVRKTPDADRASAISNKMRHLGVLVGTTGRHRNVIKVRPPLAFRMTHVGPFVEAFGEALVSTAAD
jgi:4-aminobutyrate aminotransferase-like enzyme/Ser/Thr protein kinase RdoA (MazF antagonist)